MKINRNFQTRRIILIELFQRGHMIKYNQSLYKYKLQVGGHREKILSTIKSNLKWQLQRKWLQRRRNFQRNLSGMCWGCAITAKMVPKLNHNHQQIPSEILVLKIPFFYGLSLFYGALLAVMTNITGVM